METKDNLKYIIESLLFVSDSPIMLKQIHFIMPDVPMSHIRKAVEALTLEYNERGGSFYLSNVAGGIQLRTRPIYKDWIKRFIRSRPMRLSRAALEALAIVAYKQPVTRAEVDKIRGVDSGAIMKSLVENKLIRIIGRKEVAGRPMLYTTSRRFLEVFDLNDLKDLPAPDDLEIDDADAMNTGETNGEKVVLADEKQKSAVKEAEQNVDLAESNEQRVHKAQSDETEQNDELSVNSDVSDEPDADKDEPHESDADKDEPHESDADKDESHESIDENTKHENSNENDMSTDENESADPSNIDINEPANINKASENFDDAENPMIDDDSFGNDIYDDSLEMPINPRHVRGSS